MGLAQTGLADRIAYVGHGLARGDASPVANRFEDVCMDGTDQCPPLCDSRRQRIDA
jgi:hypothetical protein